MLILFASCKPKALLAEGNASTVLSAQKIIENHYNNKTDFSTLNIKSSAKYEDDKTSQNVQAEIRIKKTKNPSDYSCYWNYNGKSLNYANIGSIL